MVLIPLILSMTGFLYYWAERTDRHLESIHEERIKLQQQLEDQRKTGSRIQGYSGSACRIGTSTEAIRLSAAASLPAAGGIGKDFLFRGRCLDRADPLSSEQHQPELVLGRSHGHPGIIKKVFAIGKVRTGQVAITK